MQTLESLGLFGLFCICFISSSLYPLGSEVFVSFFATLDYPLFLVWSVATIGNTLGSLSTYAIGYWGENFILAKHFTKPRNLEKYLAFINKYGFIGAFFSFLPFLGDIFAFVLGATRYPFLKATFFIFLGKGLRYYLLIYLTKLFYF